MSSSCESSSGWAGCLAFTGVLAVLGVIGCLFHGQVVSNLLHDQHASKPPLAVTVGNGKVLRITNTSSWPIHQVRLLVSKGQEHHERIIAGTILPHDTIEFDWMASGIGLEKGMRIELRAEAYGGSFQDTIR